MIFEIHCFILTITSYFHSRISWIFNQPASKFFLAIENTRKMNFLRNHLNILLLRKTNRKLPDRKMDS